MIIDGGYDPSCPNCDKTYSYEDYQNDSTCSHCGVKEFDHKKGTMRNNLLKYGLKEKVAYKKKSFWDIIFFRKRKDFTYYKGKQVIGKHIGKVIGKNYEITSANVRFYLDEEPYFEGKCIGTFNTYGNYQYVERDLDKIFDKHQTELENLKRKKKFERIVNG